MNAIAQAFYHFVLIGSGLGTVLFLYSFLKDKGRFRGLSMFAAIAAGVIFGLTWWLGHKFGA